MTAMNQYITASLAALTLFAWTGPGTTAGLTPEAYVCLLYTSRCV